MAEYALIDDDDALVTGAGRGGFYRLDTAPDDPEGKPWRFVPVVRESGTPAFEGVEDGAWVIRTEPPGPPAVISFEDFEARFHPTDELPAMRAGVASDPTALALAIRGAANGTVNLLGDEADAFCAMLVSAGVIDAARKAEILDPAWTPSWA